MINLNENSMFGSSEVVPKRTGDINKVHIKDILKELDSPVDSFSLGEYDFIGEFTAKKQRSPDKDQFRKVGAFFRPNYERGLLISALIKKYDIKNYLEIGYGRGYSCFCAAMTMDKLGRGQVTTVDPALDKNQIEGLSNMFPKQWFDMINFHKTTSDDFFQSQQDMTYDMIYIDGDHRYEAVKNDWNNSKKSNAKVILFDDYHLPGKNQKDMEVSSLIDQIDDFEKKMVIMDRRIFVDDRGYKDEEIDYGQVLILNC